MNDVRWSNSQLRKYLETEANLGWFADESDRGVERNRFRNELHAVLVPLVQLRLLERVGIVTDPEGRTMVCADLVDDLRYRHLVRRWVMICAEPWGHLVDWTTSEIEKAYKATAGKGRPSDKILNEIERANQ